MATNAGLTLDKIVIEIESSTSKASKNITELSVALSKLRESIKGGFNGVHKLAESLNELNKASTKLPKTTENLSHLKDISTALKALKNIKSPTGLSNVIKNIEKIPAVFASINTGTLENVTRVSNELANALTPLANKMDQIGNGYSKLSMLASHYGVQISKVKKETDGLDKENKDVNRSLKQIAKYIENAKRSSDNFTRTGLRGFKKLGSQIKQVGLSLLGTRTLFTAVRKAVSEYMQMDTELTKTTQNLWRAIGAQLAPAIEYIIYLFTQITRVIYSVVYALTGVDLIARANAKALQSMGKAAKDALGNLQKFDDLNTVDFKNNEDDNKLIELDKIDLTPIKEIIDWLKKLKQEIKTALSTGDWSKVATTFFGGIANGIDSIPWYELGNKLREIIEKIPWKEIWDGIVEIAKESFKGLGEFINGLFGAEEGSNFGENILISLLGIYAVIGLIKGTSGLAGVLQTLGLISKAPSFAALAGLFGGILVIVLSIKAGLDTWVEFFKNPTWETGWALFFDTLLTIAGVIGGIALLFGAWPVALIAAITMIVVLIGKFLYENLDAINEWATNAAEYLLMRLNVAWMSIKLGWQKMWDGIKDAGKTAINWIIGLFESFINGIISGINGLSSGLRKIGNKLFDIIGIDVTFNPISKIKIPKLETGTNEIPYEGIYHLHPGEAVVPKKYNPALGGGGNDETNEKLDTLISIMNNMNFTNIVNVGNETLYKKQQRYNKMQNDKYGTTVNL